MPTHPLKAPIAGAIRAAGSVLDPDDLAQVIVGRLETSGVFLSAALADALTGSQLRALRDDVEALVGRQGQTHWAPLLAACRKALGGEIE